ncbi:MAG: hemerythrin domain-containing protein [Trebonia sp.]
MAVMSDEAARAARAGEAIAAHRAELREVLDHWARVLAVAVDRGDPVRPVRNLLRAFLADEVLPHARAQERTLYRAARRDPSVSALVQELISDHRALAARAATLSEPASPAAVAAEAAAISALLARHMDREDSLLLPALERSGADLAALLAREPRLAGDRIAGWLRGGSARCLYYVPGVKVCGGGCVLH